MKLRYLAAVAALSLAGILANGGASAGSISGCTPNEVDPINGPINQICNLYETDPNGDPSEVSSANSIFTPSWVEGYFNIYDPTVGVAPILSDVVVFSLDTNRNDLVTLYSFDDGGDAPATFPGFDFIGVLLGSATEDNSGLATFFQCYSGSICLPNTTTGTDPDTINVFSPPDAVPEPVTLSLLGAGLAGAAALRRRRKKI